MPVTTASVLLLEPALQLARHFPQQQGLTATSQVIRSAGLSEEELKKPGARFPALRFSDVLATLIQLSDNPLIALQLGEATHPRTLGSVGFLMTTATTLEQAYLALIDYLPLIYEGAALQLEHDIEGTRLTLELNENSAETIAYLLACLSNWSRILTGHQVPIKAVRMMRPVPDNQQLYQQFFAAPMEFDAPFNQLVLGNDYLALSCVDANPEMHLLHREFADTLLSKTAEQGALVARTRNLIRQHLSEANSSVRREHIAEQLGLSLRTLQRKLGQLGTSFQDIYDQTRREFCLQLIQRGLHSFGEISYQLGFANQSAFQKAFKRWMEMPPSAYREQVRPLQLQQVTPNEVASELYQQPDFTDLEQYLTEHLNQLSELGLDVLYGAAILGERFDLKQLASASGSPTARLAIHLWPAQRAGLIQPETDDNDQTHFFFSAPEIRSRLIRSMTRKEQIEWHIKWSSALFNNLSPNPDLAQLEPLIEQLTPLKPGQRPSQADFTQLCCLAAEQCQQQKAYGPACHYLLKAISNSGVKRKRSIPLLLRCAELQLLAGQPEASERNLKNLQQIRLSSQQFDQLGLIQAKLLIHKGLPEEALQRLLQQLEHQHPLPVTQKDQLALLLKQISFIGDQFSATTLLPISDKNNERFSTQFRILEQISTLARQSGQPLLAACAIGRMTGLSLQYGYTPLTPQAFVSYSWVASWFCADFAMAQLFSAQGIMLATRLESEGRVNEHDDQTPAANAHLLNCTQVMHWFVPVAQILAPLTKLTETARTNGYWQQFSAAQQIRSQLQLLSDLPLDELKQQLQQQLEILEQHKLPSPADQLKQSGIWLIDQLQQQDSAPTSVSYQGRWQACNTILWALLMDQQHYWPQMLSWESELEQQLPGYFWISEVLFCTALMRFTQAHQQGGMSRRRRQEAEQIISRFELWSHHCPANFATQRYLLQAERCRIDNTPAGPAYEKALIASETQQIGLHRALIQERYGDYLEQQHQPSLARHCLNQAISFYQHWQAPAKVKQLEQRLAKLAQYPETTKGSIP